MLTHIDGVKLDGPDSPDVAPVRVQPVCSACGQVINKNVKEMAWDAGLIYRTVTGNINARCPKCYCNMRHMKVAIGYFYECPKCHQCWMLQT